MTNGIVMFENLSSYREGNRLEAKAARGGLPRSLWETYSAFANSSGGVILLGVEESPDRSLHAVGVGNPDKLLDDFWNTVNNPQKVSENVLVDSDVQVLSDGGVNIIQITIPRANRRLRPIYLNDNPKRAFRRNHTGDYLCRYEEIQAMMRDAADESQDSRPLPRVRMDELDSSTVHAYRQRYQLAHDGHAWNELDNNEFLRCIGAAAEADDGQLHPTVAGLLMFGHDWRISEEMPHYFLDYRQQTAPDVRWQDRVVSQGGDWTGNLYDFYFRIYSLMKQALKTPFKLEGISRVDDTPAHKALREALANCLTNASFSERRGVVCLWTEDELILENPGDFRMGLEQALRGGKSDPRNANLLKMFSLVDIGERAGSGVPSIVRNWTACGYDTPRWEETFGPDRTTLVLPLTPPAEGRTVDAENRRVRPAGETGDKSGDKTGDSTRKGERKSSGKSAQKSSGKTVVDDKGAGCIASDDDTECKSSGKSACKSSGEAGENEQKSSGNHQMQKSRVQEKTLQNRQIVLTLIHENNQVTTTEVADILKLGKARARRLLHEMVSDGLLAVDGASRSTVYRLANPDEQAGGGSDA